MTGKYRNNISLRAKHWEHQNASNRSYRNADSKCDVTAHIGEWICSSCPHEHCLHDFEKENESVTNQVVTKQIKKVSVYQDEEDYQFNVGR